MKILLLSCSTGEGHNHCALAVKEALQRLGHQAEFLDMLNMFGDPGPLSFDKVLNRISTKAPDIFGMMYHAGQMYSATGVTSPVYLANIRHAKQLCDFVCEREYDAVLCSHLFPMETLTYLERASDQCSSIAVMMLARNNENILQNHYDYLREIHAGNDAAYSAEKERRREQYIKPLKETN